MKFLKLISVTVIAACLSTTAAFAAPEASDSADTTAQQKVNDTVKKDKKDFIGGEHRRNHDCVDKQEFSKDPIKTLEKRKEKIQSLYKEGKITKEKADEITRKIDTKIKEINEFNKLPLQKKKEKLINSFKTRLDKQVKEGMVTKEKRDELIKDFTQKVEKWDGNGFPQFHGKFHGDGMKNNKGIVKE